MNLRSEIIKRPLITTLEVLANPLISKKNHFVTGFVHKPYPPIYLMLARNAGFDSSIVIRGTEGGVVPSLRQKSIFRMPSNWILRFQMRTLTWQYLALPN